MSRRNIIIGYTDSPDGEDALRLGGLFAAALDAIGHVAVVMHPAPKDDEGAQKALDEFGEQVFESARRGLGDVDARERPLFGPSVARSLYQLADELSASLIVLGSAHHGVGRIVLGSVSGSLLSGAPCSIAVAPVGFAADEHSLERIGVAVDGTAQGWRALQAAAILAGATGGRLVLITVDSPHHYLLGGALSAYSAEEFELLKAAEPEAVLDEAAGLVPDGLEFEKLLVEGPPADALPAAAASLDVLAMGSRAYGPVKGALLGSVSSKLIAAAPCPVLVVPRGSGTDPLET